MPKKSPSAKQVLTQAEKVVKAFSQHSTKVIITEVAKLNDLLVALKNHNKYWHTLARSDERLAAKREGATIARNFLVQMVRDWEGSDLTVGQLIYDMRTTRIVVE